MVDDGAIRMRLKAVAGHLDERGLLKVLKQFVTSATRGDPEAAMQWTSRSVRHLAAALAQQGYRAGPNLVRLASQGSRRQPAGQCQAREGFQHPQPAVRAHQPSFEHFQRRPTISVNTKKKELIGDDTAAFAVESIRR